ncbi:type II toxin-antitoxin system RnlA family toxin [Pseudomonas aeruginosa]|uniref:type II toxin-antitoxin system RnlA family toxin n=1 Tax=Pseudomonas aeruginosa TaxID=287 RepID=UPI003A4E0555
MSDHKDLPLDREKLDTHILQFMEIKGYEIDGGIQANARGKRICFGAPGSEFALVDIFLNNDGTTTIHWAIGKNREVGNTLADYLKSTIDPGEFESINLSLKGITIESFEATMELLNETGEFNLDVKQDSAQRIQICITSKKHQDHLTVTLHKTTRVLQIQGKPLSCYRHLTYLLTDLLDVKGLEMVLCKKEDGIAEIVRKEIAEDYLKTIFSKSYIHLPNSVQKLLLSSCCVKLASPVLPDYCMLLYPDLRALEGVLRENLNGYNMAVSEAENGFGEFFEGKAGNHQLRAEFAATVGHEKMVDAFNLAYSFLSKHRNALFHMKDFADGSRLIDTLEKLVSLSKEAYERIDYLYTARM